MIADIVVELAGGALRAVGRVVADVFLSFFFELAVQGTGFVLCRPFKADVKPDGKLSTVVGLSFWVIVIALVYVAWKFSAPGSITK